jgi:hypothetical protein
MRSPCSGGRVSAGAEVLLETMPDLGTGNADPGRLVFYLARCNPQIIEALVQENREYA